MQRVFVLSKNKQALMPCMPARARQLLKQSRARVFRAHPFTIILIDRTEGVTQHAELNIDPGSKTTGIALVVDGKKNRQVFFAANFFHRGHAIKQSLTERRSIRRSRRQRKTRYRQPRFLNRTKKAGWLPPSLMSRVDNIVNFVKKLTTLSVINGIAVETVRFDTQKLINPEISGVQYQQGTLQGYEIREYLLEKWQRQCAYCQKKELPLEIDHLIPRSKGGSNRVSNLTLACHTCNQKKGNISLKEFLKTKPQQLEKLLAISRVPLKDAACVNATRYRIGEELEKLRLPIQFCSGGRTKYNRTLQHYQKDHWIDAACLGEKGEKVLISANHHPLIIEACGRGSRQMCRVDRYGFPRTTSKKQKLVHGFKTGDLVKAIVVDGKKIGTYRGRVAVRSTGNFNVKTKQAIVQGIHAKYCSLIQRADGYNYIGGSASSSC